ncbi:MAG: hypothetical protein R2861_03820 [Desulfobacterales bacterium]
MIFFPTIWRTGFDALYGDAAEGAYNIALKFKEHTADKLIFEFHLTNARQNASGAVLPMDCPKCLPGIR